MRRTSAAPLARLVALCSCFLGACATTEPPPEAPRPEAEAAEAPDPLPETLDHQTSEYLAQFGRHWPAFRFHGAIMVARGDEVGVDRAYGSAHLVDGVDNETTTRFRLGTLSAPLTAVVVLRLAEEGKLSLDDHIDQWLPEVARAQDITVEHLLSHRSGLPSFSDSIVFGVWKKASHPPTETMQLVQGNAPEIEPGSEVWPSNTNYLLLGIIAEKVTGETFGQLATRLVIEPAAMTSTTYGGDAGVARGMQFNDAETLDLVGDVHPLNFGASGAFVSTTGDVHRFMRALARGDLLQEASRDLLFGRTPEDPGYGFVPDIRFGRRVLTWPGLIDGFNGTLAYYPQDDTTVVVLANSEVVPTSLLAATIGGLVYGEEAPAWEEARPAPVPLDEQVPWVGRYELTDASANELAQFGDPQTVADLRRISVVDAGDHLVLDVPNHARRRMHPLAADHYFFKDVGGTTARAQLGVDGVRRLTLQQRGGPPMKFALASAG